MKALTSLMLALGVLMALCWPWVLRDRPRGALGYPPDPRLAQAYEVMLLGYAGATMFAFMTAGTLSGLMIRNVREEFATQAIGNIQQLVEGSLEDLKRKGGQN